MDIARLMRGRLAGHLRRLAALIVLPLILSACAFFSDDQPFGARTPRPVTDQISDLTGGAYPVQGIDVSYYQGTIDWPSVAASGNRFAFIKATEGGDRLDEKFAEYWRGARAAGIRRGAYHFWYHCRPGSEQADWFIRNVPKDPNALPPVLDMEWTPDSPTCTVRPDRDVIHKDMQAFLDKIEAHYGKRPIIYTSVDFYRDRMIGAFEDYPLFVRSVAGHPREKYGDRPWHFWQHTATGSVPGVTGNVDRNVFYGTQTEWARFIGEE